MSNNHWPVLRPHVEQRKYYTSSAKWNYVCVGRQAGKTELGLRKLVRHLPVKKPWPDPRYFYSGPTFGQAKRTAWDRLLKLIPQHWVDGEPSITDLSIKTIFGSELFVFGLDKPQRIEGSILDGGIIDECSDIKLGTFDLSVLPTLVWRDGWTDFLGIPKRFGVGATEYRDKFMAASRGELPDSAAFSWSSDGVVPQEYLELCRKTMDVRDFDEQFNATWLTATGGIFHAFDRGYNVRPCSYDPALSILIGMDFNVNPLCFIVGQMKGTQLDVIDEIFLRNSNTPEALNALVSRWGHHKNGFQIYGDASSRARHTSAYTSDYTIISGDDRLKKLGRTLHFDRSNPPVADRFAETNARICSGDGQRHVFVDPKCKQLIHDLEARAYKPGTREANDSGLDSGHMTDALGYVIHKLWPIQIVIPNNNIVTIHSGA